MHSTRPVLWLAAAAILAIGAAQAQDAGSGAPAQSRQDRIQNLRAKAAQRFEDADADHDGRISADEADGRMPRVSAHFSEIDADHDGFVTREELAAFMRARAAERRRTAAPAP
jgi:hypothetical protein